MAPLPSGEAGAFSFFVFFLFDELEDDRHRETMGGHGLFLRLCSPNWSKDGHRIWFRRCWSFVRAAIPELKRAGECSVLFSSTNSSRFSQHSLCNTQFPLVQMCEIRTI